MKSDNILKNPESIDAHTLRGFALLEIQSQKEPATFNSDQVAHILSWLKTGGALLVVIDEERRTPLVGNGVNKLLASVDIGFTGDTEYLHNCGALAKAGAICAADREVPYSGGRAVFGGTSFAYRLEKGGGLGEPFATYTEVEGGGRVVAMAEAMAYLGLGSTEGKRLTGVPRDPSRTTYWGKDSRLFMQEVRTWLMASSV